MTTHTKELLRLYADKYERTFPSPDPSEVMLAADGDGNREATAFVASCLSFGAITQFKPKIEQLVAFARGDMDGWIRSGEFARTIPDDAGKRFYRFATYANLYAMLGAYSRIMRDNGTLGEYVRAAGDGTGLGAVKAMRGVRGHGRGVPRACGRDVRLQAALHVPALDGPARAVCRHRPVGGLHRQADAGDAS